MRFSLYAAHQKNTTVNTMPHAVAAQYATLKLLTGSTDSRSLSTQLPLSIMAPMMGVQTRLIAKLISHVHNKVCNTLCFLKIVLVNRNSDTLFR